MKTMTCKQLGGACDLELSANTFEEIAELSKAHGMEMFQQMDAQHMEAIGRISALMQDPSTMQQWFDDKRKEFEALPHN